LDAHAGGNFLHRTGILARFNANHLYGAACYRPGGCADIIAAVAHRIDARQFNSAFPRMPLLRCLPQACWRGGVSDRGPSEPDGTKSFQSIDRP
jgi:hypothetical protein